MLNIDDAAFVDIKKVNRSLRELPLTCLGLEPVGGSEIGFRRVDSLAQRKRLRNVEHLTLTINQPSFQIPAPILRHRQSHIDQPHQFPLF